MFLDIDCNHILTIDPKQFAGRAPFLTVTLELNPFHAAELLIDILKSGRINDDDIKQALKDHRAGLYGEIGDEAIADAKLIDGVKL